MRRKLTLIVAMVLVAGAGTIAVLVASSSAQPVTTIKVIEHAVTDKVIDVGKTGDSSGDLLTFHNKVYDEADATVVGRDQGSCVRISPKQGTWECVYTTFLEGGEITVETPFYDTADSVGTMNRLEATVVDGERGRVSYAGREIGADAVRGRRSGERVLVLVRPEAMSVEALPDGEVPEGSLVGRVAAQVFLGSVTRLKIETEGGGELTADLPSTGASGFQAGTRVVARFTPDIPRVLDLPAAR